MTQTRTRTVKRFIPDNCRIVRAEKTYKNGVFTNWYFKVITEDDFEIEWMDNMLLEIANDKDIKVRLLNFLYEHPRSYDKEKVRDAKIKKILDD